MTNYRHEAIIDLMLSAPHLNRNQIAEELGYTAPWLSTVCSSDAFKMRLAERRQDFEGDLNHGARTRLHELDAAASQIIKDELAKTGKDADPHYALAVKKIVQTNLVGGSRQPVIENNVILQKNTQINATVLQRAREKLLKYSEADADSDLFGEVIPSTGEASPA